MAKGERRETIGWREWVALPELGILKIKAKVDTGAKSSSLHAREVKIFNRKGIQWIRFETHPIKEEHKTIIAEAKLVDYRIIKSSTGHEQHRAVIETDIELMGERWPVEITLARREPMGFRMLLGRQAVKGRFIVDPSSSFHDKTHVAKKRKIKKKR